MALRFPRINPRTSRDPIRCEIPGFGGRLLVKSDDNTGFAMGGNKGRQLEFTIANALAKGAPPRATLGGVQDNQVRQTAAAAAWAGLVYQAILTPALTPFPTAHVEFGDVRPDIIFGAVFNVAATDVEVEPLVAHVISELAGLTERPMAVPPAPLTVLNRSESPSTEVIHPMRSGERSSPFADALESDDIMLIRILRCGDNCHIRLG